MMEYLPVTSEQIQKYSMAVTAYQRFLSMSLSENDNGNVDLCGYRSFVFYICCHCGYLLFSYPYGIALSIAKMEKAVGILRL